MSKFAHDFDWQTALVPEVKRIIANYLVSESPIEEDMHHATDLMVLRLDTTRVAVRLRRHSYLKDYGGEFTVREGRPAGTKTELAKILEGWGDYVFYGFATTDEQGLAAWVLGDLSVFRLWHHREAWAGRHPGGRNHNNDGSSWFRAYRIENLPDEFVVAREVGVPV